jgi:hypothetical protein
MNDRKKLSYSFVSLLVLVVSVGLYLAFQDQKETANPPEAAEALATSRPRIEQSSTAAPPNVVPEKHKLQTNSEAKQTLPLDVATEKTLTELKAQLQQFERDNSTVLRDKELEYTYHSFTRIESLSQNQLDKVYSVLSKSLKELGGTQQERKALWSAANKLIDGYYTFPKKYKYLYTLMPKSFGGRTCNLSFTEFYADDPSPITPDQYGLMALSLDGSFIYRGDAKFGNSDSWATQRYGDLFKTLIKSTPLTTFKHTDAK